MLKVIAILALVSVAYAAVERFPSEEKPPSYASQEGCYLSKLDMVLAYEQPYYPGNECSQYVCQNNGETLYETCGAVALQPGCQKAADDLSKNYPDCCGTQVCSTC